MNETNVPEFREPFGTVPPVIHVLSMVLLALALSTLVMPSASTADSGRTVLLATTTSVRDSALLDALLPDFTEQTRINVRVIAVGTGAALRMGREGNADLLLTHAPTAEQVLVNDGVARRRTPFMENHFVIVGPADDPAGVAAAATPEAAMQAIASSKAGWVSRADDSGTHKREVALWKAAGLSPDAEWNGFVRTGSGMGISLQVAGEKRAYILSDIGTFLAFAQRIDLEVLSKPSDSLRNVYSLIQLEGSKFDHALKTEEAEALEDYFLSAGTLRRIGEFGRERYGRGLFIPIATTSAATSDGAGVE
jgi:tungstate transport system substrate-binding protein